MYVLLQYKCSKLAGKGKKKNIFFHPWHPCITSYYAVIYIYMLFTSECYVYLLFTNDKLLVKKELGLFFVDLNKPTILLFKIFKTKLKI